MSNFRRLIESAIFEAASDKVKERLIKKYMTGDPNIDAHRDYYANSIDLIHDHHLPDSNKSQADLEWMADRHFSGDSSFSIHGHVSNKHLLTEFNKPAIKDKMPKKKLNQYKSWGEFEEAITPHLGTALTAKEKADADTKVIFKNDTHIVRQHMSQDSMVQAAKLQKDNPNYEKCDGKATWCVSVEGDSGKQYYNRYTEMGKHPFYTIEHTENHPSDPNRKYAVLANPESEYDSYSYSNTLEFRNEPQDNGWEEKYVVHHDNSSISNTPPLKYLHDKLGYKGNSKFEREKNGEKVSYTLNREGKKHGLYTIHDKEGLKHLANFNNGKLDGVETKFDSNTKTVTNWKNGEKHGSERLYHIVDNNIASEVNWHEGNLHGLSTDYHYDEIGKVGNVSRKAIYNHGKIVESENFRPDGTKHTHNFFDENGNFKESFEYKRNGIDLHSQQKTDGEGGLISKTFFSDGGHEIHHENYVKGINKKENFDKDGNLNHRFENNRTDYFTKEDQKNPAYSISKKIRFDEEHVTTTHYHKGTSIPKKEVTEVGNGLERKDVFFNEKGIKTYETHHKGKHLRHETSYDEKGNVKYSASYNTFPGKEKNIEKSVEYNDLGHKIVNHYDYEGKFFRSHHFDEKGNLIKTEEFKESFKSRFRKIVEGN